MSSCQVSSAKLFYWGRVPALPVPNSTELYITSLIRLQYFKFWTIEWNLYLSRNFEKFGTGVWLTTFFVCFFFLVEKAFCCACSSSPDNDVDVVFGDRLLGFRTLLVGVGGSNRAQVQWPVRKKRHTFTPKISSSY